MLTSTLRISLKIAACAASLTCSAQIVRSPIDGANMVVIGELLSVQKSADQYLLQLNVNRLLKGDFTPSSTVLVEWKSAPARVRDIEATGQFGIWLLRENARGSWTLIPARGGGVPLSAAYYPLPRERAAAAEPSATATIEETIGAELEIAVAHFRSGQEFQSAASGLLTLSATERTKSIFRRLSQSQDLQLRSLGLIGLVTHGDVDALEQVQPALPDLLKSEVVFDLGRAIRVFVRADERTTTALGRLAIGGATPVGIQIVAAEALRRIHTKECVPYLAALLDSSNSNLRQEALKGLSMFVERRGIQTPESVLRMDWMKVQGPTPYRTFETNRYSATYSTIAPEHQPEYVAFWKEWWERVKGEIGSAKP